MPGVRLASGRPSYSLYVAHKEAESWKCQETCPRSRGRGRLQSQALGSRASIVNHWTALRKHAPGHSESVHFRDDSAPVLVMPPARREGRLQGSPQDCLSWSRNSQDLYMQGWLCLHRPGPPAGSPRGPPSLPRPQVSASQAPGRSHCYSYLCLSGDFLPAILSIPSLHSAWMSNPSGVSTSEPQKGTVWYKFLPYVPCQRPGVPG